MSDPRITVEQLRRWATAALCDKSLEHGEVFRRAADTIEALMAELQVREEWHAEAVQRIAALTAELGRSSA